MRELALFAGGGGGVLGGTLLGWTTTCAVEVNPYARKILLCRQRDGWLPRFPIWDDVCTFDGKRWRGEIDVITGGFPCQDISSAGSAGCVAAGIEHGERSGLWTEMARIVGEVRPRFVLVENSPMLVSRGLDIVLGDLAAMGFDARWGMFSAAAMGAAHQRKRLFLLAYPARERCGRGRRALAPISSRTVYGDRCQSAFGTTRRRETQLEALVVRDAHGMADRVDRIRALGNGQVPAVAAFAFERLSDGLGD